MKKEKKNDLTRTQGKTTNASVLILDVYFLIQKTLSGFSAGEILQIHSLH